MSLHGIVSGRDAPEDVRASVEVSVTEIAENHARTVAVIANRCPAATRGAVAAALSGIEGLTVTTLPEVPLLYLQDSLRAVRESQDDGQDALFTLVTDEQRR